MKIPPLIRRNTVLLALAQAFVGTGTQLVPVMTLGTSLADRTGADPLMFVWFMLPIGIVPGMVLVWFIRPDPKTIAQNLSKFYPGYVPSARTMAAASPDANFRAWATYFPLT